MLYIRQGATHKVVVGIFVDVADGFTPETGITLGAADEAAAILHDNGTIVDISGYTWAAITSADGHYHLTLQSGITGTVGHVTVVVNDDSVCLPVFKEFTVLEESVYDNMYAAAAVGPLTAAAVNAEVDTALTDYDGPTNAEMIARTILAASYFDPAADTVATVTTVTGQVTAVAIADQVWDELIAGHVGAGSTGKALTDVLADTNELQQDDVPGLIAALNDPTAAGIADAVWDEILTGSSHNIATSAGRRLRTLEEGFVLADGIIAVVTDGTTCTLDTGAVATADYYIHERLVLTEGTGVGQARIIVAYTAGRVCTLDRAWATNPDTSTLYDIETADVDELHIADAVWDEPVAEHTTAGTFGKTDADILADTNELQADDVPGLIAALNDPTAAVVADAVWNEARAGHVGAGSFGEGVIVETNSDKTGYAIGVGGIASTAFAAGAINAAATSVDFIDEIWDKICEDQASITAQQIMSLVLAACAGVTAGSVFSSPNGVSTRITATLAAEERTAIVLAPSAGA